VTTTEILPDDVALRAGRRERVFAEMDAAGVDILVIGREANARYVSGAPRLWTAGSRPFGPGCIVVRATRDIHLLSTWDEGIPDDIPHEHLHGITFNAMNVLGMLKGIEGAETTKVVATDALTPGAAQLLPAAFPAAEIVDGEALMRRARAIKTPEEIDAIRASVAVAERSLAAAAAALAPGATERQLTGVFMEAMAEAGVTTPATQDVAWITSRDEPWRRASRDSPVAAGDLVAFDGGVVAGGYVGELGRTYSLDGSDRLLRRWRDLWDRLVTACRPGAPLTDLLDAYDAAGVATPPMPVARGLGLGFDLPLVTPALTRTAAEQRFEPGMVLSVVGYVWEEGIGGVYGDEPVVITPTGPDLLSTNPYCDARSLVP
jgi:Xaa-Pro dipeptidase